MSLQFELLAKCEHLGCIGEPLPKQLLRQHIENRVFTARLRIHQLLAVRDYVDYSCVHQPLANAIHDHMCWAWRLPIEKRHILTESLRGFKLHGYGHVVTIMSIRITTRQLNPSRRIRAKPVPVIPKTRISICDKSYGLSWAHTRTQIRSSECHFRSQDYRYR
eukprot:4749532-Pleurochrysis_carterae.AAC.6